MIWDWIWIFLINRIKFKFDYYYRYTKDKLWKVNLPSGGSFLGGFSKQWRNAMEVSNEGIEFEVTCDILRETKVTWRSKITASRNWNRFEKSYSGKDEDSFIIGKPLSIFIYIKTMAIIIHRMKFLFIIKLTDLKIFNADV